MKRTSENVGISPDGMQRVIHKDFSDQFYFKKMLEFYPKKVYAKRVLETRGYDFPRDFSIENKSLIGQTFGIIRTLEALGIVLFNGTTFEHKRPYEGEPLVRVTGIYIEHNIYVKIEETSYSSDKGLYVSPSGYGEKVFIYNFLESYQPVK